MQIKPGTLNGDKIELVGEGDEMVGRIPLYNIAAQWADPLLF